MSRYDAIVIGGGLNGLVAATILARRGKSVCLLEQSDGLGGMARPGMAHLLYNLSPLVRREIGLDAHKWPFATTSVPAVALNPDGPHLVVRGNTASLTDGTAHPEADRFRGLVTQLTRYGDLLRTMAEGPPPGSGAPLMSAGGFKGLLRLMHVGLGLKRMNKPDMRRFLQMLLSNAYDLILDDLKDGPLAGLLAADAVRGAAAGPRAPGTVFSLIYRMGHGGGAAVPVGGMSAVIGAFEAAAEAAGVEIKTNAQAASILMEDGRVSGVEIGDRTTLAAKTVLTSTGPLQAAKMAGLEQFDIEATRRMRHIRARGTAAKVNLSLKAAPTLPGLPDDLRQARFIHAPSADYVERAFNPSKYKAMSQAPVLETVLSEDGHASVIMQYAPVDLEGGWTAAAKDKLRQITVETLAQTMPDLPSLITDAEVITPDQIEADTGAPGGHWHHAEMTLDQLLTIRPANGIGHYAMGPKGLYLCGASAHPGGDLMGLAGRNAAHKALEDMT